MHLIEGPTLTEKDYKLAIDVIKVQVKDYFDALDEDEFEGDFDLVKGNVMQALGDKNK